jgi:hypothetical protein
MAMINQHNPYTDLKLHKQDVEKYLLSHGWQPVEHPFKNLQVFDGLPDDEGKPIRLAIPAADHFRDADRRIYEAIETIAGVEDRSIDAVTADIKRYQEITGYWKYFVQYFPEEVVAEMIALHQRLLIEGKSHRYIQARIIYEFIELIWAFRILIPIDNLNHPSKNNRVDDLSSIAKRDTSDQTTQHNRVSTPLSPPQLPHLKRGTDDLIMLMID